MKFIKNFVVAILSFSAFFVFSPQGAKSQWLKDELEELAKSLEQFHYIPVFSRELPEGNNKYRTGYVHGIYEQICRNNISISVAEETASLKPASFFLCGWKNMIDEAKHRIHALGYDRKSVHQELYGCILSFI